MFTPATEQSKIKYIKTVLAPFGIAISFYVKESTGRIAARIYAPPVRAQPDLEFDNLESVVAFAQGIDFLLSNFNLGQKEE